mmetsp:Transcript_14597/g.33362  ORF Transcript_14597/g.33362 Transcript_14597/m.33362 type:complete len:155 (-) Transcript_14597:160-624(-)
MCAQDMPADPSSGYRCAVGHAILTPAYGELIHSFDAVIHTVPPFFGSVAWRTKLQACYQRSLELAEAHKLRIIATPLLGCGARGAPAKEGAQVAAEALCSWDMTSRSLPRTIANNTALSVLRFALQQEPIAQTLVYAFDRALARVSEESMTFEQ